MAQPTAGKQEAILVIGSSIVAGFGASLYEVPLPDYVRWTSQFVPVPPPGPQVVTFDHTTERVNLTGHGMPAGTPFRFGGSGTPPAGVVVGAVYYVANPLADSFQFSPTYLPALSGFHQTFADNGSGTTTVEPTAAANRPYVFQMPGVRVWTPRRPWCNNTSRLMNTVTFANTVTHQGAAITPSPKDQWMIVHRGVGRGNLRRITDYPGANTLVCAADFAPLPALGDEFRILQDAHTFVSVSADGLTVTQTDDGPVFVEGDVGRFCSFFDSPNGGETTRKIVAQTDRTLTFDRPLTAFPCAAPGQVVTFNATTEVVNLIAHGLPIATAVVFEGGVTPTAVTQRRILYVAAPTADSFRLAPTWLDAVFSTNLLTFDIAGSGTTTVKRCVNGLAVLRGANACHDVEQLQPPNAVLQDLTFTLDDVAPVFLTGVDYSNWDATPFASPRALSFAPTVNAVPELAFHCKSRIDNPLVVLEMGISASMLSTFALPPEASTTLVGPLHDITSLDFSPASPKGIYEILTKSIESMKALVAAEPGAPQLDVVAVFVNLTDNDFDQQRRKRVGANMTLLRDEIREYLAQLGQAVPPKWIMSGPANYMGGPSNNGDVYTQLEAMVAADSTGSALVNTRPYADDPTLFAADALHLSALGEIRLARDWFEAWLSLDPENQTDAAGDSADDGGGSEDDGGAGGGGTDEPLTEQSAQGILDVIDNAVRDGADVASYEVNGRRVDLRSLDELLKARRFYQAEAAKASGLRRTRVGFSR